EFRRVLFRSGGGGPHTFRMPRCRYCSGPVPRRCGVRAPANTGAPALPHPRLRSTTRRVPAHTRGSDRPTHGVPVGVRTVVDGVGLAGTTAVGRCRFGGVGV